MAMYLCFSICILLLAAQFTNRAQNAVKYLLLYSLLIFLLALLAKAPLIALVVIAVHYAFVQRKNLYRYKAVLAGTVAVVAAAWLFIPFVSQRVNEMLQAGAGRTGSVADNSVYARQQIWHVDMDLLRQHWLTGIGPGRIYETFLNQMLYYSLGNGTVLNIHDPHNEYVYEWLSFGVLGIILFATILIVYLTRAIRAKDHLFLYLLIILYTTFFTETVLSTQHGVLFFTVFTAMLFYSKPCLPAGRP
jgi:O-antigen ligase